MFKVGDKVVVKKCWRRNWDASIQSWGVLYDTSNTFYILKIDKGSPTDPQIRYVIGILDSLEASETLHKVDGGESIPERPYNIRYGLFTESWFEKAE